MPNAVTAARPVKGTSSKKPNTPARKGATDKKGDTFAAVQAATPGTNTVPAQVSAPPASPGTQTAPINGPRPVPAHLHEVPPNAYKTLVAVREMGYDSLASVMDIIDNSVDAQAKRIAVQVRAGTKGETDTGIIIDVLDDGIGMDEATLGQALRLGSDTERKTTDLGKYGMGLVSASLSMAQSIYVLTRKDKGQAYEANFNMAMVKEHNKFLISLAPATAHAKVVETLGDRGTLVRLSNIDRINDTNVARFAATLRTKLAQVYRVFMAGKDGLKLSVNGKLVKPADPLMRDHPGTEIVLDKTIHVADATFKLTVAELPDLGTLAEQEAGIFPHNSGFYIVRNGRQIVGGETFDFYRHHHSYSHFRAELAFDGGADPLFHVDIKKSSIHPDERLLAKLRDETEKLIANSGRRGRDRGTAEPATLKLDNVVGELNRRMTPKLAAAPAPGTKGEVVTGKMPALLASDKTVEEGQNPPATGKPAEPADTAAHTPKVRFGQEELSDPAKLFKAVEKDGQWLVTLNTNHPMVRTVAEARHKAASAVLTYFVFALATTAEDMRNGQDLVDKIGVKLAEALGAGEAQA